MKIKISKSSMYQLAAAAVDYKIKHPEEYAAWKENQIIQSKEKNDEKEK
jgi:hypothetical protein